MYSKKFNRESTLSTTNFNSSHWSHDLSNRIKRKNKIIVSFSLPKIEYASHDIIRRIKTHDDSNNIESNVYLTEMKQNRDLNYQPSYDSKNYPIIPGNKDDKETKNDYPFLSILNNRYNKKKLSHVSTELEIQNINRKTFKTLHKNYTAFDYLEKTKEIARIRYSMMLKNDSKERYEKNLKEEMKGFEDTLCSLEKYKEQFDNNFYLKLQSNVKKLERKLKKERDKLASLQYERNKKQRENSNLEREIIKKKSTKEILEKWILLQIKVKEGKEPNDLKEELKRYPDGNIFNNLEEFEDKINEKEDKTLKLMIILQEALKELEEIKEKREEPLKNKTISQKEFEESINLAEKKLEKKKKQNHQLEKEKINSIKMGLENDDNIKKQKKKVISIFNFKDAQYLNFQKLYMSHKNNLYHFIYNTYYLVISKLDKCIDNLSFNFLICKSKQEKMIAMLNSIEKAFIFLEGKYNYYQSNSEIYGERLKNLQTKLDVQKKERNSNEQRLLDIQRIKELHEGIDQKLKPFIKQTRKVDRYPFELFCKKKTIAKHHTKSQTELGLSDFLYNV